MRASRWLRTSLPLLLAAVVLLTVAAGWRAQLAAGEDAKAVAALMRVTPSPQAAAAASPQPALRLRWAGRCGSASDAGPPQAPRQLAGRVAAQVRKMHSQTAPLLASLAPAVQAEVHSRAGRLGRAETDAVVCCGNGASSTPSAAATCDALTEAGCTETAGLTVSCGSVAVAEWRGCAGLSLVRHLRFGGKTALYLGERAGERVAVKHFTRDWYDTFAGFHTLAAGSVRRHPWMNFPTWVCGMPGPHPSALQVQPLLDGPDLSRWRAPPGEGWPLRLRFMLRIACVFRWLHAHPLGPFSFDDNHPSQYVVHRGEGPVMVDLDTVRRTEPDGSAPCRCFACKGGRANCVFPNSPEGFRSCRTGSTEPVCGTRSDMWFVGLLLWHLLPGGGGTPLSGVPPRKLASAVMGGKRPDVHPATPSDLRRLIARLWAAGSRPNASEAVDVLSGLCRQYDCGAPDCPAETLADVPYTAAGG
eukprot:TRINITY_DN28655_c0_g1_i1.p1 TRINITY_DN28655_c0_g1~~TRINITY_DN28655_c0_g1_i1.p1  ORF type:complete len:487 (+),score=138.33 TRINITY_DN28655_c0_g1_i1:44-1462(+)